MTEPTETEIEAMAHVIGDKAVDLARGKWEIEWPWLRDPDSNAAVDLREIARAALTIAREPTEPNSVWKPGGVRSGKYDGYPPTLPSTEPDSGPSVLGNEE